MDRISKNGNLKAGMKLTMTIPNLYFTFVISLTCRLR